MAHIQAIHDNATYISEIEEQRLIGPDWVSTTGFCTVETELVTPTSQSTESNAVYYSEAPSIISTGESIIAKLPASNTVIAGIAGAVTSQEVVLNDALGATYETSSSHLRDQGIYWVAFLEFSNDGLKMYAGELDNDGVRQYTLSEPWNVSTATYDNIDFVLDNGYCRSIKFNSDGTVLYALTSRGSLNQYNVGTAWDLSTATLLSSTDVNTQSNTLIDMQFSESGTSLFFMVNNDNGTILEFSLDAWDASTLSAAAINQADFAIDAPATPKTRTSNPFAFSFAESGSTLYILDERNSTVDMFALSTPYDLSAAKYTMRSFYFNQIEGIDTESNARALTFSADYSKLYILGEYRRRVMQFSVDSYTLYKCSIDISGLDLSTVPEAVGKDNLPELTVCPAESSDKCFIETVTLGAVTSTTTSFAGIRTDSRNPSSITLLSGDQVICYESPTDDTGEIRHLLADAETSATSSFADPTGIDPATEVRGAINSAGTAFYTDLEFSNNGSVLYVLNGLNEYVYTFNLSTPYDISTAGDKITESFSEDFDRTGSKIRVVNNGTLLLISDIYNRSTSSRNLCAWTLSTPYDLSSRSDKVEYNTSEVISADGQFDISADGSTIIFTTNYEKTLISVNLTTPWDISTIDTDSAIKVEKDSIGILPGYLKSLRFNTNGSALYMNIYDDVFVCDLSVPYDLSTISYNNKRISVDLSHIPDFNVDGFAFNDDYSKLYVITNSERYVLQIDLVGPTKYELLFSELSFVPTRVEIPSKSVNLGKPGRKWVGNNNNDLPYTAISQGYVLVPHAGARAIQYKVVMPKNTKLHTVYLDLEEEEDRSLIIPKPWAIGALEQVPGQELSITGWIFDEYDNPGITAKPDGSEIYLITKQSSSQVAIKQLSLATGYDLSSVTNEKEISFGSEADGLSGLQLTPDGRSLLVSNGANDGPSLYNLSTPWDITSAQYTGFIESDALTQTSGHTGISFSSTGLEMYIADGSSSIYQYTLAEPYNIYTITYTGSTRLSEESRAQRFIVNDSGTIGYVVGLRYGTVYQYTLSTPYQVDSATYNNTEVNIRNQEYSPGGITMSPDGTKMLISGTDSDSVVEYTLSTPHDLSTATYARKMPRIDATDALGHIVSNDGTKLFVLGKTSNTYNIFQYTLSTPFSIYDGVTYDNISLDLSELTDTGASLRDIAFNNNGTLLFILSYNRRRVYQVRMPVPYDLFRASVSNGQIEAIKGEYWSFSPDGRYAINKRYSSISSVDFSTPWDFKSGITRDGTMENIGNLDGRIKSMSVSPDGHHVLLSANQAFADNNVIYKFYLRTPWDVSSATYQHYFIDKNSPATVDPLNSFYINPNTGKEVLIRTGNTVHLYTINTSFPNDEPITINNFIDQELESSGWSQINTTT